MKQRLNAKLMKFQTRIKFCCRNRCWEHILDRNIPMNCSYQSVWSTRGMLFQLLRDGSSDWMRKLIARVTHVRSRHAQFVYFFQPYFSTIQDSSCTCRGKYCTCNQKNLAEKKLLSLINIIDIPDISHI